MTDTIAVTPHPSEPDVALARPAGFLGATFQTYILASRNAGAVFNRGLKAQTLPADRVPLLESHLTKAGFIVAVDEALVTRMQAAATALRDQADRQDTRTQEVGHELAARGLTLWPFQVEGVAWLMDRTAALLADDMGLGKTIQALCALPARAPVVVVCPAVVKGVWQAETAIWRPGVVVRTLSGRGSFRWPVAGELVILNYDILPDDAPAPPAGTVLIADEAHALKNGRAQRTKRFRALSKAVLTDAGRVWLLTGTPMLNRESELWAVLEAARLGRAAFGDLPTYRRIFPTYRPSPEFTTRLRRVSLKRHRTEVLPDLPTKTYRTVTADIDVDTRVLCDQLAETIRPSGLFAPTLTVTHWDAILAAVNTRATFEQMSRVRAALAAAKIPALLDLVAEYAAQQEPLVVFSAHRAPIDLLGQQPGWAVITGDVPPADRTAIVQRFQAGELQGLAITIKAGGVGLTLTHAHHAVFVDLEWTPGLNAQAEDRVCRIGQDRGVLVTRLVADHEVDQRVTLLLHLKQQLIAASVDAAAVDRVSTDVERDRAQALEQAAAAMRTVPSAQLVHQPPKPRRAAQTPDEHWAATGLVALAAMDPDHAGVVNHMGFSKLDNAFGHSLATALATRGALTEKQWAAAVRLCIRYRRQIAPRPSTAAPVT